MSMRATVKENDEEENKANKSAMQVIYDERNIIYNIEFLQNRSDCETNQKI